MAAPASSVTLRALEGEPLSDEQVRRMVIATAEAIAERVGVQMTDIRAEADSVTVTLAADRIAAIGFAAELRRLTTSWYRHKFGADSLWGIPPPDESDAGWDDVEVWR